MKRIQSACLNQTIHFQSKDDMPRETVVRDVKAEYESYKKQLDRKNTKYRIIDEQTQDDGSIIVKLKKQINQYNVGDYFN